MDEFREARSLRSIRKLGVVIEPLPLETSQKEFYQQRLQTQIEEKLSCAGIEVLPELEAIDNGFPYLHVNINVLETDVGLYVFATRVCLKQLMLLLQEPHQDFYTSTWEVGGVGTVGLKNSSAMLGSICQHVDQFCQDYLAENPKLNGGCPSSARRTEQSTSQLFPAYAWIRQLTRSFSPFQVILVAEISQSLCSATC